MKYLNLIVFLVFTNVSIAGQFNDATISSVAIDSYGIVRVTLNGGTEVKPPPQCTSSSDGRQFTYDLNGPSGSGWHSIVLSAQATQSKIHIIGKNSCLALWNSTPFEEVNTVYILSQ